jgi:hypothetical protein
MDVSLGRFGPGPEVRSLPQWLRRHDIKHLQFRFTQRCQS